jgi:hypothetical protein
MCATVINRKYHLHRKLRKQKICFSVNAKTIFLPANIDLNNSDVNELVNNYKYQIQLEIPLD